jgi:2-keto-4-pentenoate hydratase/2-oxohepta-3-ene-1,7-dioic acid hydratase in catechol pathway
VNDWSARRSGVGYQPLGPCLAKNFATTISRDRDTRRWSHFARRHVRDSDDPQPLPYLSSDENRMRGAVAIILEVSLQTQRMHELGIEPHRVSVGRFNDMYWTLAQLVTHHASGGCNLRAGDLLASGTVSGATKESRGCLLERESGAEAARITDGRVARILGDGDVVVIAVAHCERPAVRRIGFGECRGRVVSAIRLTFSRSPVAHPSGLGQCECCCRQPIPSAQLVGSRVPHGCDAAECVAAANGIITSPLAFNFGGLALRFGARETFRCSALAATACV